METTVFQYIRDENSNSTCKLKKKKIRENEQKKCYIRGSKALILTLRTWEEALSWLFRLERDRLEISRETKIMNIKRKRKIWEATCQSLLIIHRGSLHSLLEKKFHPLCTFIVYWKKNVIRYAYFVVDRDCWYFHWSQRFFFLVVIKNKTHVSIANESFSFFSHLCN